MTLGCCLLTLVLLVITPLLLFLFSVGVMVEGGPILWILTAVFAAAVVMAIKTVAEEAEKQKIEKAKTESKRSQELQRLERKELNKEIIRETQKRVLHWVKPADKGRRNDDDVDDCLLCERKRG